MKFKNIKYLPEGGAELVDMEVGEPGPGEVQVENTACGICSWDLQSFRAGTGIGGGAPPGHEGIGYVTKLGSGVTDIEVGQRVCGGGFGRFRNVPVRSVYKIPDSNLGDEHWIVEPASCVVTGIDCSNLKVGQRVAMVGCGFMGLMMLQGIQGMSLDQVIALDIDDRRLKLATQFGATETYNTSDEDFDDIQRDLQRRELDVVVDTSGSQQGLDISTAIVKRAGLINIFGWLKGSTATFNPSTWHGKGISIVNSSPSARLRDPFPAAIRLIEKGQIDLKPLVTHVVPIDDFPTFMSEATTGKVDGYIKGVITTGGAIA